MSTRFGAALFAAWALVLGLPGCGADATVQAEGPEPSFGVTQGGAQDIARFRSVVAQGFVPEVDLLDPVGFLAEHALPQPPADCGDVVCVHPSLAVAPRFNGSNWTMAFISMNTPVTPDTLTRPPVHLVVLVEWSSRTAPMSQALRSALDIVQDNLRPDDRVSVVQLSYPSNVYLEAADPSDVTLSAAAQNPTGPTASVDLYTSLSTAYRLAESLDTHAGRVLVMTSGHTDRGITDPDRIVQLAEAHAERGTALSVIGVGNEFRADIARRLGDLGAGTYAYAETAADLENVVEGDMQVSLVPIARRAALRVTPAPGYRVGRVYGARRAARDGNGGVLLTTPALFVGLRAQASDTDLGRRGGGGGLFVELVADPAAGVTPGAAAYTVHTSYEDALTGALVERDHEVRNALAPGENPPDMWPEFTDPEHPKAFMALNLYLALRAAVVLYDDGDCGGAMGVADMMGPSVEAWQSMFRDPDIDADWLLLQRLELNIGAECSAEPVPPLEFDGGCFLI